MNQADIEQLKKITNMTALDEFIERAQLKLCMKHLKQSEVKRIPIQVKKQADTEARWVEVDGIYLNDTFAVSLGCVNEEIIPSLTHLGSGLALVSVRTKAKAFKLAAYVKKNIPHEALSQIDDNVNGGRRPLDGIDDVIKQALLDLRRFY